VLDRKIGCDVLRHVRREPAVTLPDDEMRRVRRIDDVGDVDPAAVLLAETLEHPFRSGTLELHLDVRVFRLERLRDLLGDGHVDRRVEDHRLLVLRLLDELGGHLGWRWCVGTRR
jgi:hypothetical protein